MSKTHKGKANELCWHPQHYSFVAIGYHDCFSVFFSEGYYVCFAIGLSYDSQKVNAIDIMLHYCIKTKYDGIAKQDISITHRKVHSSPFRRVTENISLLLSNTEGLILWHLKALQHHSLPSMTHKILACDPLVGCHTQFGNCSTTILSAVGYYTTFTPLSHLKRIVFPFPLVLF